MRHLNDDNLIKDILATFIELEPNYITIARTDSGFTSKLLFDNDSNEMLERHSPKQMGPRAFPILIEGISYLLNVSADELLQDKEFTFKLECGVITRNLVFLITGDFGDITCVKISNLADENSGYFSLDDSELSLSRIGVSEEQALIHHVENVDSGIFFFSGPRGCGKVNTIKAILNKLKDDGKDSLSYVDKDSSKCNSYDEKLRHFTSAYAKPSESKFISFYEIRNAGNLKEILSLAEEGKVIFATIPTSAVDVKGVLKVLIDMLPEDSKALATRLSKQIKGIVTQALVPICCEFCYGEGCVHCLEKHYTYPKTSLNEVALFEDMYDVLSASSNNVQPRWKTMFDDALLKFSLGIISEETMSESFPSKFE